MKASTTQILEQLYFIWNFCSIRFFRVQNFQNFWEINVLLLKMVLRVRPQNFLNFWEIVVSSLKIILHENIDHSN